MKNKICIISLTDISRDARVLRQIQFLSKVYSIVVIGFGPTPREYLNNPEIVWHALTKPGKGFLRTILWVFSRLVTIPYFPKLHPAYKILMKSDCEAIHVNNWDSLPMAAEVAKQRNQKLVLDIHESYNSWYWGISTPIIKYVLKKYSIFVHTSTTVVKALSIQHKEFGLNPIVVMNAPEILQNPKDRTIGQSIHLIHHGVATHARRSDLMVKTIALCDIRYDLHLVFINQESKYVRKLQKLANQIAPGRVHFHDSYPPLKIVGEISKFDIGFFPLPPTNYNYQIALPNKLFEFIAAGLAVFIGPSPSMAAIVQKHNCGIVASSFDPNILSDILNHTTNEDWTKMKKASREAAKVLNAEIEMGKVLTIYEKLFEMR